MNVALGLSVLSWAWLRWKHADPATNATPVQWTVLAMHACAGALLLLRAPARREGSPKAILAGLPCFVLGLWLMRSTAAPSTWPTALTAIFVAAGAWTLASLLRLGRSFAIFPSLRQLVTRGPYGLIRHPAYAGETVMLFTAAAATRSVAALALALLIIPLLVMRIWAEERTLADAPGYQQYVSQVRYRLAPGVW